jgi:adenosylmethionine---8-amino-7-oxononanoate aminotransferase
MHPLAKLDQRYVWHPFTQMRDWLKRGPIVIVEGEGALLRDVHGREYLDANSSIWTNLHGHNHPSINRAIRRQLGKIAHSSSLGFANQPASHLAARLVQAANGPGVGPALTKTFFSDDGSTATEVALKLAYEYARRTGRSTRPRFLTLQGAYHGDTVGAISLGHIDLFHKAYGGLVFRTDSAPAPYCYRCNHNKAEPERADAREYRQCKWECVNRFEQKLEARKRNPCAAFMFEPLIQGASGMIPQPSGWLRQVTNLARSHGALLIADEVMTGFGRTGSMFACHSEAVEPDLLAMAKGLTGGYLPMAATLTSQAIFEAFLGEYEDFKTFFHGHSFTGNQLGAAAGLASLDLLQSPSSVRARGRLETLLRDELESLWSLPQVGDVRQIGLIVGIELVRDWRTRQAYDLREKAGIRVCEAMARRGVLTRPIGNVLVLMPPYCATASQVRRMIQVLGNAIASELKR